MAATYEGYVKYYNGFLDNLREEQGSVLGTDVFFEDAESLYKGYQHFDEDYRSKAEFVLSDRIRKIA